MFADIKMQQCLPASMAGPQLTESVRLSPSPSVIHENKNNSFTDEDFMVQLAKTAAFHNLLHDLNDFDVCK